MNKRGILNDLPQMIVMIIALAFLVLTVYIVVDNLDTAVQGEAAFAGAAQDFSGDFSSRFPKAMDGMIVTLFFGMMMVLLGVSWLLAANGIVFFIVWIITVLVMALAGFLGNAWISITSSSALSAAVAQFPWTNFIMSYYLIFTIVQASLMIMVFFAKSDGGGAY